MPRPTIYTTGGRFEWALRTARRCQRSIALAARAPWLHRAPSRRSAYVERIELLESIGEELPPETKARAILPARWLGVLEYHGHCKLRHTEPHVWLSSPFLLHTIWQLWLKPTFGMTLRTLCAMFVKPDGSAIQAGYLNDHPECGPGVLDKKTSASLKSILPEPVEDQN